MPIEIRGSIPGWLWSWVKLQAIRYDCDVSEIIVSALMLAHDVYMYEYESEEKK